LVGESGEGGAVWRCVGVCGEFVGVVGFLLAEDVEPVVVAVDAFLAERGGELAVFEGLEVALQFAFEPGDLGTVLESLAS
jgi:hypothetical protein